MTTFSAQNTPPTKVTLQNIKDRHEHVQDYHGDQLRHAKYDSKLNRKTKARHLKNHPKTGDDTVKCKIEKDKRKYKHKELDRQRKNISVVPEGISKEEEKNVPSVIVLHKYKKGMLNSQTEPYTEEANSLVKVTHHPEKSWKKSHTERKSNSYKQITNDKSSCNEFEVEGKHSLDYKQQLRDKNKKKRDKVVVYKTLSTNLDAKLRKKRRKIERQQTLKEVVSTLNTDTDIYDKIKTLPINIDENQLIFMHPTHIAKALELIKLRKNNQETVHTNLPFSEPNGSKSESNNQEEQKSEASLKSKVPLDKNSSKKLKILSSIKKMKKSIPVVLEEKSDISFIKVSKQKKDPSKRRSKKASTIKNQNILEESEAEEKSGEDGKVKINDSVPVKDHLTDCCSVTRQNVCFGDNPISLNNVHDKLGVPINDGFSNYNSKINNTDYNLKNSSAKEIKIRRINKKEMEKLKKLIRKNGENENKIQPCLNEDENKLSFQLLKYDANSKNHERLRKNVYSVSDRMGSKENIPAEQNDKLYVTKRMLFYSNKESTSTSKESLNIAIRRDTEISNSGSSNNILNVVIKQKKNSSTSTKSVNSPKFKIENKYSKHCDTKSLEKMIVENYIGQIYKNNEIKECKQLKEAECQTEGNTFNSDTKVGIMNEVSTQSFGQNNNNILQDEFRSFLTYHLKNVNPCLWDNNTKGKINEAEPDKNQHFHSGSSKLDVQNKLEDNNQPILLNENFGSLTSKSKKQYNSYHSNNNATGPACLAKHYCNPDLKPFVTVLNSEEFDSQNSKCDQDHGIDKIINTSVEKVVGRNVENQYKVIPKPEVSIFENQCHKTESETIAEKLKNIGLSDKTSFIKIINSNNKLDTCTKKVNSHSVINFKTMKSPRVTKGVLTKPVRVTMRENLRNVKTRIQRSKFFLPTNLMSVDAELGNKNLPYSLYDQIVTNDGSLNSREKCLFGNNITKSNLSTINCWQLEGKNKNNLEIITEDSFNEVKQNFINVLSVNDKVMPKAREMAKHIIKKNSYGVLRNFIGSEAEMQSEKCDLKSVPYKNVGPFKNKHSKIESTRDTQNTKEASNLFEEPILLNKNNDCKLISTFDLSAHTYERKPFLRVIDGKFDTGVNETRNNVISEEDKNTFLHVSESKDKRVSIFKTTMEENQIIDKINAVYDFLLYLDKMLKNNWFLRVDVNHKNTNTIGHFNNTLRCLCINCIEILNKIEMQKIENEDTKSVENLISHPVNKVFYRRQAPGEEIKNELYSNVTSSSNGQYVTLSGTKNNVISSCDQRSNNNKAHPFCVIVNPEDQSHQNYETFKKVDCFESNILSENNSGFEYNEDFIKSNLFVLTDDRTSNNMVKSKSIENEHSIKTVNDNNDRICKEIQRGLVTSNDNSSKTAQVIPAVNNGSESGRRLLNGYNHSLTYQSLDEKCEKHLCDNYVQSQEFHSVPVNISKNYSNSIKNVSTKNNTSSPNLKSEFFSYITPRKDFYGEHCNQINNTEIEENNINHVGQCSKCCVERSCKNSPEPTVERKNDLEIKHKTTKFISHHAIKSFPAPANFTNISENTNKFTECKMKTPCNCNNQCHNKKMYDEKFERSNDQKHTNNSVGSSNHMPLTNTHSPRGSVIIMKRDPQKDSSKDTSSSNSVEYLNSSIKCDQSQDSKEFDSDGWIPLNDITKMGNNQIYLDLPIKNGTVRHVEYVQKFPENFSKCK